MSIQSGHQLLHYRIVSRLGAGGMGEVYRAEDTKLGRVVALKVLPADTAADPTRLVRLQQEARALAALDHPNIVTLLSVEEDDGVHFLTMTLVEGQTLTKLIPPGGMPLYTFFDIAIPLAEALTAAHAKGLIHRDLKPSNVMVNDAGIVKVLDFGLAKLIDTRRGDETATMGITQEGAVVGTPSYMSPEQLENDAVDHRSDIFSLGVVLHEMASGQKPFTGKSTPALMSSILKDTPLSVTELRDELPSHLGRVVSRCLAKNPDQRFQTARDVANELVQLRDEVCSAPMTRPRIAVTPQLVAPDERSVAVLPFVNRSPNPDDEYFSDGLSEELISALSKLEGLKVTARSSAFQFRGQEVDVREVGRKLGVETVLEGSVRVAGNRLRITAQLVDCSNGYQLWSERYDGEMKDIFDTQDEIAQAITGALKVELGSGSDVRLVKRGTDDADAYHLYLRGRRSYLGALGESGIVPALDCFTRALERDPSFALAHASVAECQLVRSIFGTVPGSKGLPLARQAAERALALDDGLPEAHMAMGACYTNYDHDWERAERAYRRALELGPQTAWIHFFYACYLSVVRRHDEAIASMRRACELDPLSDFMNAHLPLLLFFAGNLDEAEREAERCVELFPECWFVPYARAWNAWTRRDAETTLSLFQQAIDQSGAAIIKAFAIAARFTFGRVEEAQAVLASLERRQAVPPAGYAFIHTAADNTDEAIRWIERARDEHDATFVYIRVATEAANLVQDDRVTAAMERVGLP